MLRILSALLTAALLACAVEGVAVKAGIQTGGVSRLKVKANGTFEGEAGLVKRFDVQAYGATDNGRTDDDTAAINQAIAAFNTAGKGVLYFPAGTYKTTAGLTPITATGLVLGDGAGSTPATQIDCTSATAVLFTTNTLNLKFQGLTLNNTNTGPSGTGVTPSAGAAIRVTNSQHYARVDYESLYVNGFYDGIDIEVGGQWAMYAVEVLNVVRYGVRVRNIVDPDTGDWNMSKVVIANGRYVAAAGLRVESSGGGKVSQLKVNGSSPGNCFLVGVQLAVVGAATVIFQLADSSIENVGYRGVEIIASGGSDFKYVNIDNVQLGMYRIRTAVSDAYGIYLNNVADSMIDNIVAVQGGGAGAACIEIQNSARVTVGKVQASGFGKWINYDTTYVSGGHSGSSGWINVTFQNSWANYGAGYQTCQYAIESGVVHVKCAAAGGTIGSAMFTLPDGFRPAAKMRFPTVEEGSASYVEIDSAGVVTHKGRANGNVMFVFSFRPL